MQIESDKDFDKLRNQFCAWRKRFPMFVHDVQQIEKIVNYHIQTHSKIMVSYRQTRSKACIEKAQAEIDAINRVISTVEKIELMSILSQR